MEKAIKGVLRGSLIHRDEKSPSEDPWIPCQCGNKLKEHNSAPGKSEEKIIVQWRGGAWGDIGAKSCWLCLFV